MSHLNNVVIKSRFECEHKDKQRFPSASCVVLVSIGQPVHEGAKLAATLKRCVDTFDSVTVAVCDSLQRHSLRVENGLTSDEAYDHSNQLGKEWIQNYSDLLITCNEGFFRWDDWLFREDFKKYEKIIFDEYANDENFKLRMDNTVDDYTNRVINRVERVMDTSEIKTASFHYLVEECAIIMLMWQTMRYNYIVYPSSILEVMQATYERFVLPQADDLLKWVRIKLKTKQPLKLQACNNTLELPV